MKQLLSIKNLLRLSISLFLFSLFFPINKVFIGNFSYFTGDFSNFLTFSLYLSQILVIFIVCLTCLYSKSCKWLVPSNKLLTFLIFWLFLGTFWNFQNTNELSFIYIIGLLEAFVSYETVKKLFQEGILGNKFLYFILSFSVILGIVSLLQFIKQGSLGLGFFGESAISGSLTGVAKLIINGQQFIRAYGTLPHPNALSAYLFVSILAASALFLTKKSRFLQFFSIFLLFVSIFSFTLTFSRAAFLATGVSLILFYIILLALYHNRGVKILGFITLFIILSAFLVFKPFLITRAKIFDETSKERGTLNHLGVKMIKSSPMFGLGPGQTLYKMQKFSNIPLKSWQFQPIHNYFLLSAAELGIVYAFGLLLFFLFHVKQTFLSLLQANKIGEEIIFPVTIFCMLVGFLILMQFDHYFYTLHQTRLLFWIILGISAGLTKNPLRGIS